MPEDDVWYYEKDGQQYGPVSHAELQRLIESGFISRHNLAWRPGEKDWSASGTFHDLAAAFKTPPPVKKPPPPPPPLDSSRSPQPQPEPTAEPPEPSKKAESKPKKAWYESFGAFVAWCWNSLKKINKEFGGKPGQKLQELFTHYPIRMWLAVILGIGAPTAAVVEVYQEVKAPPKPVPTSLVGTRVPTGYIGPVGQIKIDAYPSGQLTRFVNTEKGTNLAVPGTQSAPMVLLVAPGSYSIELDNGQATCDVVVAAEQSRTCRRILRTVDSATYYQEVGW